MAVMKPHRICAFPCFLNTGIIKYE